MTYKVISLLFLLLPMLAHTQSVKDTIKPRTGNVLKPNEEDLDKIEVTIDGDIYEAIITEKGDTFILADLDDISVTSLREFDNDEDYQKYLRFRRYASFVFPYAKEAIRIYREWEYASQHMGYFEKRRKLSNLEDELTEQFEEPLKKMTKLQGKIMIKMIEKETGKSMHKILSDVKGGFTAFYWHNFSKLYGYDLKEGYSRGQYDILDAVIDDFDLTFRIENNTTLKYVQIGKIRKKK